MLSTRRLSLHRDALVDALAKATSRLIHGEVLFILFKESLVVLRNAWDLVNVRYALVGTVTGNETSGMRIHALQVLVFAL